MSFPVIDRKDHERRFPHLLALLAHIETGDIEPDVLVFDERVGRWRRADEMDAYQATLASSGGAEPEDKRLRHFLPRPQHRGLWRPP